jgi:hypothetical protein
MILFVQFYVSSYYKSLCGQYEEENGRDFKSPEENNDKLCQ